jgi:hypothetical protein
MRTDIRRSIDLNDMATTLQVGLQSARALSTWKMLINYDLDDVPACDDQCLVF